MTEPAVAEATGEYNNRETEQSGCAFVCASQKHRHTHTCSTSDMENRPSHAQLTSNTLYTPQTIHLPGVAISGPLKAALCQHFAKYLKKSAASRTDCQLEHVSLSDNTAALLNAALSTRQNFHVGHETPRYLLFTPRPPIPLRARSRVRLPASGTRRITCL